MEGIESISLIKKRKKETEGNESICH